MPPKIFTTIESVSSQDLDLLTQLLSLPAGQYPIPNWLSSQKILISTLPPSLQAPISFLYHLPCSHKAHLCNNHKAFHTHLIQEILLHISAECTIHLRRLYEQPGLPEEISTFLRRMQRVESLWMSPHAYVAKYPHFIRDGLYEGIPCKACVLVAIGGSHQILSDLLASMLGRKKKTHSPPPLMRVVQAWLDWTENSNELVEAAEKLGRRICACRKEMQEERRAKRRVESEYADHTLVMEQEKPYTFHELDLKSEDEDQVEVEISEVHVDLLTASALDLHTHGGDSENAHQLKQNSTVFELKTGSWKKKEVAYTESVYGDSHFGGPIGSVVGTPGESAVEHAKAYMKLVGAEKEDESRNADQLDTTEEYISPRVGWIQNWSFK